LWASAPTPAAVKPTERKVARILTAHRIRRLGAAEALAILKRPALTVAPGTTDAAKAHIAAAAERLRLVNRQLKEVTHGIDVLVNTLAASQCEPGQIAEQRDAANPALFAGSGKDRPRHAARRGPPSRPSPRLSRLANFNRGRTGNQA
jgi:hypothetical protein